MHVKHETTVGRVVMALNAIQNVADHETDRMAVEYLNEARGNIEAAIVRLIVTGRIG